MVRPDAAAGSRDCLVLIVRQEAEIIGKSPESFWGVFGDRALDRDGFVMHMNDKRGGLGAKSGRRGR